MPKPAIAADLLKAFDVHGDLAAEVTLDGEAAIDDLSDLRDRRLGEIAHAHGAVDPRLLEHVTRGGRSDAEDVAERHVDALLARDVNAGDTCHDEPPLLHLVHEVHVCMTTGATKSSFLTLALLVLRLRTDHEDLTVAS